MLAGSRQYPDARIVPLVVGQRAAVYVHGSVPADAFDTTGGMAPYGEYTTSTQ